MLGLTESEAQKKLKEFGLNKIPQAPPIPWWKIFLSQFTGFVVVILLFASLASFLIAEYLDGFFILLIVLLNSLLGFYQELKAQKDIRSLKTLITTSCRVFRNGKETAISTEYLVPEDVAVLNMGDKIPADGILLSGTAVVVNEAVLTGESVPVQKEIKNELFMATIVLSGYGKMLVKNTGSKTKFGSIAQSLSLIKDEKTPLEQKLEKFSKRLGLAIIFGAFILFLIGVSEGRQLFLMFLQTVSLAVAVIPEGLPAVFTITLAIGMQRMAKKKAVIRKLSAAEGLGSTNIICTDKTGTLTKNEMTVRNIWLTEGNEFKVAGVGYSGIGKIKSAGPAGRFVGRRFAAASKYVQFYERTDSSQTYQLRRPSPAFDLTLQKLIEVGVLCNSSSLVLKKDGEKEFDVLGDTTEGALLILGEKAGINAQELKSKYEYKAEFPFNSQTMMMSVVVQKTDNRKQITDNSTVLVLTKGAPERILEVCQISEEERKKIQEKVKQMSSQGLRVLALASKNLEVKEKYSQEEDIKELNFLGLTGIYDPPRPEAREAILSARRAGIRSVMLTGDNPWTALKIASEVGLSREGSEVVTGEQLNQYNDEVFGQKLFQVNVFARVNPMDKLKIVEFFKQSGNVVAVTGDGVNDAPSLKKADIGVAMGQTGTEVAKEASDMVILDDNFSTIVKAVEEGRVIFDNISKAIKYLLSSNLGETLTVVAAILFNWPLPLIPQQILWLNLVSDGLPALALAVDPKDPNIMIRSPRDKNSSFLNTKDLTWMLGVGISQALIVLVIFKISLAFIPETEARLIAFSLLVLMETAVAFLVRGKRQKIFSNKLLLLAAGITVFFQILILTVPMLRNIFS